MNLTATQQNLLVLIAQHIEQKGFPPSQTEMARALGFRSVRAAQYHLEALEAAGAIRRLPGVARGIRLLRPPLPRQPELTLVPDSSDENRCVLPVYGQVAAGTPVDAESDTEDTSTLLLDRALFDPSPDYLLQVRGDSMRDDGILDGDLVGVHRCSTAENGQVVIASIEGEITIKRLERKPGILRLLPRNPAHQPIEIPPDAAFAIAGLYCGLLRPGRRRSW